MTESSIIHYTVQTLLLVLTLSLPPILMAAIVGTLISFVQAVTQIQDQTIGFVGKLLAIFGTIYVMARWLGNEVYNFTVTIFDNLFKLS